MGDRYYCIWQENEDGAWETDCENIFELLVDTPKLNRFMYCPYCGKPILQKEIDDD